MFSQFLTGALLLSSLVNHVSSSPTDSKDLLAVRDAPVLRTADVLSVLEAQGGVQWSDDGTGYGGKLAYFSLDDWSAAEQKATASQQNKTTKRESTDTSLNERSPHHMFKRTALPGGMTDSGGVIHIADILCYGSGQWAYNQVTSAIIGGGLAALATTAEAGITGQWVWSAPVTPSPDTNKVAIVLKITKWTAVTFGVNQSSAALSKLLNNYCAGTGSGTGDNSPGTTEGGYVNVYANSPGSWTNGALVATYTADPNNNNNCQVASC